MRYKKGFTLVELLVVIAIIGILAVIAISSMSKARMEANDAAVTASVSSFRAQVEIEFGDDYTPTCSSEIYHNLETYIVSLGGELYECESSANEYIVIVLLPSDVQLLGGTFGIKRAYAQSQQYYGYCVNSYGTAGRIVIEEREDLKHALFQIPDIWGNGVINAFCTEEEAQLYLGREIIVIPGSSQSGNPGGSGDGGDGNNNGDGGDGTGNGPGDGSGPGDGGGSGPGTGGGDGGDAGTGSDGDGGTPPGGTYTDPSEVNEGLWFRSNCLESSSVCQGVGQDSGDIYNHELSICTQAGLNAMNCVPGQAPLPDTGVDTLNFTYTYRCSGEYELSCEITRKGYPHEPIAFAGAELCAEAQATAISCSAEPSVIDGVCGPVNGNMSLQSEPTDDQWCSSGNITNFYSTSFPGGSGGMNTLYTWRCQGIGVGAKTQLCQAMQAPIH